MNCFADLFLFVFFSSDFTGFLQKRKLKNKSMNCLHTYFSLSSRRIVQVFAKKKTRKQKHELFASLLFLFCLLFLLLHVFAKKKTRKQEHELFADLLFLFVFSF